ncbi:hypothetical protein D8M34_05960 [Microbacterium sp. HSID17254]|uniref:hypothetical protein n=1 Tax=Microbacterium sp. HSID17254 TaxID=2419509 RepID=UPI000F87A1E8|nr:hypothetical protein [Microbacterium sp. HSID17254]RUQ07013.1 hypothetical protein D8M34_05960 [Microbacterium sp. HSID17254]
MTTRADYIRSDELADAAVRVSDLPKLFGVSRSTIDGWIAKDSIHTFEHPVSEATGRPPLAVRFGDLPIDKPGTTRWHAKVNRKNP